MRLLGSGWRAPSPRSCSSTARRIAGCCGRSRSRSPRSSESRPEALLRRPSRRRAHAHPLRVRLHRGGPPRRGRFALPEDARAHQHRLERGDRELSRSRTRRSRVPQPQHPLRQDPVHRPARHRERPAWRPPARRTAREHPPIDSYLGLPLHSGDRSIGMRRTRQPRGWVRRSMGGEPRAAHPHDRAADRGVPSTDGAAQEPGSDHSALPGGQPDDKRHPDHRPRRSSRSGQTTPSPESSATASRISRASALERSS